MEDNVEHKFRITSYVRRGSVKEVNVYNIRRIVKYCFACYLVNGVKSTNSVKKSRLKGKGP